MRMIYDISGLFMYDNRQCYSFTSLPPYLYGCRHGSFKIDQLYLPIHENLFFYFLTALFSEIEFSWLSKKIARQKNSGDTRFNPQPPDNLHVEFEMGGF